VKQKNSKYIGIDATVKGRIINLILKFVYRKNNGHYILNEEWDNLIILDACRYDLLEYRISRGANTPSFLLENFGHNKNDDIVYVSGNPYTHAIKDFVYKEIPVYLDGWSKELNTVPPEKVYYASLKAIKKYKDKKFVIHFMQPHHPFLTMPFTCKLKGTNAWTLLKQSKLSKDEVLKGYRENLRILRPYVEKLVRILGGKIVVTSDHGNGLGEKLHPLIPKGVYGHSYAWIRIEPLIKVPWFITQGKSDKTFLEQELIKLNIKKFKI